MKLKFKISAIVMVFALNHTFCSGSEPNTPIGNIAANCSMPFNPFSENTAVDLKVRLMPNNISFFKDVYVYLINGEHTMIVHKNTPRNPLRIEGSLSSNLYGIGHLAYSMLMQRYMTQQNVAFYILIQGNLISEDGHHCVFSEVVKKWNDDRSKGDIMPDSLRVSENFLDPDKGAKFYGKCRDQTMVELFPIFASMQCERIIFTRPFSGMLAESIHEIYPHVGLDILLTDSFSNWLGWTDLTHLLDAGVLRVLTAFPRESWKWITNPETMFEDLKHFGLNADPALGRKLVPTQFTEDNIVYLENFLAGIEIPTVHELAQRYGFDPNKPFKLVDYGGPCSGLVDTR